MQAEEIRIPRKIINQLLHHAQQFPDSEVCGLIGARQGVPVSCYPVKNAAKRPARRFLLDGRQQIDAMKKMRDRGEHLYAIYHSHPTTAAMPSRTDLEMAAYPEVLYLIISLNTKGVLEMRGFSLSDNTAREIPLCLAEEDH